MRYSSGSKLSRPSAAQTWDGVCLSVCLSDERPANSRKKAVWCDVLYSGVGCLNIIHDRIIRPLTSSLATSVVLCRYICEAS